MVGFACLGDWDLRNTFSSGLGISGILVARGGKTLGLAREWRHVVFCTVSELI